MDLEQFLKRDDLPDDLIKAIEKEIAERKELELALRISGERFYDMIDSLPESIFEIDVHGIIRFANRSAYDKFGYKIGEFGKKEGLPVVEVIHPIDHDKVLSAFKQVLEGKRIGVGHFTAKRKDGSTFPIIVHTSIITDQKNIVKGMRGIMIDVSHLKMVEKALFDALNQYNAILTALDDNEMYVSTSDYKIEFMNKRLIEKIGKYPLKEPCYKVIYGQTEICDFCPMKGVLEKHTTARLENIKAPNSNRMLNIVATPMKRTQGQWSMLSVIRERKLDDEKE